MALEADDGYVRAKVALDSGAAAERFSAMVRALGGPSDIDHPRHGARHACPVVRDVYADTSGPVNAIDTRAIGMAVVVLGGGRTDPGAKIDHGVGLDHLMPLGSDANARTPIARIHARDEAIADEAERRIKAAYTIGEAPAPNPTVYRYIEPTVND
jgi:thymidine phosphorylase